MPNTKNNIVKNNNNSPKQRIDDLLNYFFKLKDDTIDKDNDSLNKKIFRNYLNEDFRTEITKDKKDELKGFIEEYIKKVIEAEDKDAISFCLLFADVYRELEEEQIYTDFLKLLFFIEKILGLDNIDENIKNNLISILDKIVYDNDLKKENFEADINDEDEVKIKTNKNTKNIINLITFRRKKKTLLDIFFEDIQTKKNLDEINYFTNSCLRKRTEYEDMSNAFTKIMSLVKQKYKNSPYNKTDQTINNLSTFYNDLFTKYEFIIEFDANLSDIRNDLEYFISNENKLKELQKYVEICNNKNFRDQIPDIKELIKSQLNHINKLIEIQNQDKKTMTNSDDINRETIFKSIEEYNKCIKEAFKGDQDKIDEFIFIKLEILENYTNGMLPSLITMRKGLLELKLKNSKIDNKTKQEILNKLKNINETINKKTDNNNILNKLDTLLIDNKNFIINSFNKQYPQYEKEEKKEEQIKLISKFFNNKVLVIDKYGNKSFINIKDLSDNSFGNNKQILFTPFINNQFSKYFVISKEKNGYLKCKINNNKNENDFIYMDVNNIINNNEINFFVKDNNDYKLILRKDKNGKILIKDDKLYELLLDKKSNEVFSLSKLSNKIKNIFGSSKDILNNIDILKITKDYIINCRDLITLLIDNDNKNNLKTYFNLSDEVAYIFYNTIKNNIETDIYADIINNIFIKREEDKIIFLDKNKEKIFIKDFNNENNNKIFPNKQINIVLLSLLDYNYLNKINKDFGINITTNDDTDVATVSIGIVDENNINFYNFFNNELLFTYNKNGQINFKNPIKIKDLKDILGEDKVEGLLEPYYRLKNIINPEKLKLKLFNDDNVIEFYNKDDIPLFTYDKNGQINFKNPIKIDDLENIFGKDEDKVEELLGPCYRLKNNFINVILKNNLKIKPFDGNVTEFYNKSDIPLFTYDKSSKKFNIENPTEIIYLKCIFGEDEVEKFFEQYGLKNINLNSDLKFKPIDDNIIEFYDNNDTPLFTCDKNGQINFKNPIKIEDFEDILGEDKVEKFFERYKLEKNIDLNLNSYLKIKPFSDNVIGFYDNNTLLFTYDKNSKKFNITNPTKIRYLVNIFGEDKVKEFFKESYELENVIFYSDLIRIKEIDGNVIRFYDDNNTPLFTYDKNSKKFNITNSTKIRYLKGIFGENKVKEFFKESYELENNNINLDSYLKIKPIDDSIIEFYDKKNDNNTPLFTYDKNSKKFNIKNPTEIGDLKDIFGKDKVKKFIESYGLDIDIFCLKIKPFDNSDLEVYYYDHNYINNGGDRPLFTYNKHKENKINIKKSATQINDLKSILGKDKVREFFEQYGLENINLNSYLRVKEIDNCNKNIKKLELFYDKNDTPLFTYTYDKDSKKYELNFENPTKTKIENLKDIFGELIIESRINKICELVNKEFIGDQSKHNDENNLNILIENILKEKNYKVNDINKILLLINYFSEVEKSFFIQKYEKLYDIYNDKEVYKRTITELDEDSKKYKEKIINDIANNTIIFTDISNNLKQYKIEDGQLILNNGQIITKDDLKHINDTILQWSFPFLKNNTFNKIISIEKFNDNKNDNKYKIKIEDNEFIIENEKVIIDANTPSILKENKQSLDSNNIELKQILNKFFRPISYENNYNNYVKKIKDKHKSKIPLNSNLFNKNNNINNYYNNKNKKYMLVGGLLNNNKKINKKHNTINIKKLLNNNNNNNKNAMYNINTHFNNIKNRQDTNYNNKINKTLKLLNRDIDNIFSLKDNKKTHFNNIIIE